MPIRYCLLPPIAALLALPGCSPPANEITTAETLLQMGDEINALREDNAVLQSQVDSLRTAIARQDTILRRLANIAGMPVR